MLQLLVLSPTSFLILVFPFNPNCTLQSRRGSKAKDCSIEFGCHWILIVSRKNHGGLLEIITGEACWSLSGNTANIASAETIGVLVTIGPQ
jgi:hypothetical protein